MLVIFSVASSYAQFGMRRGFGRPYHGRHTPRKTMAPQYFKPSVSLSVGYGFPNEDKLVLPQFTQSYMGSISQNGPITGSIDYHFTPGMSIGVLVTHGKVMAPYYDDSGPITPVPAFTGSLENTAVMINLVRYIPGAGKVAPYFRTAIGLNIWNSNFVDNQGGKLDPGQLPDLAYQVGLGAKFKMSKNSSFFVEAGYGKYILHGGLSIKL